MNTTVDEILMVLFIQKMDAITSAMFEDQISQSKFTPGFAQMDSYLDKEIRIWESRRKHRPLTNNSREVTRQPAQSRT